jgi:hypothetical protein
MQQHPKMYDVTKARVPANSEGVPYTALLSGIIKQAPNFVKEGDSTVKFCEALLTGRMKDFVCIYSLESRQYDAGFGFDTRRLMRISFKSSGVDCNYDDRSIYQYKFGGSEYTIVELIVELEDGAVVFCVGTDANEVTADRELQHFYCFSPADIPCLRECMEAAEGAIRLNPVAFPMRPTKTHWMTTLATKFRMSLAQCRAKLLAAYDNAPRTSLRRLNVPYNELLQGHSVNGRYNYVEEPAGRKPQLRARGRRPGDARVRGGAAARDRLLERRSPPRGCRLAAASRDPVQLPAQPLLRLLACVRARREEGAAHPVRGAERAAGRHRAGGVMGGRQEHGVISICHNYCTLLDGNAQQDRRVSRAARDIFLQRKQRGGFICPGAAAAGEALERARARAREPAAARLNRRSTAARRRGAAGTAPGGARASQRQRCARSSVDGAQQRDAANDPFLRRLVGSVVRQKNRGRVC